jgi:N-dimethylarginine dimethylaminohydrolase
MVDLSVQALRPRETRVLFADPAYYDVEYVINPHMAGNVGGVDRPKARTQWDHLVDVYRTLGIEVHVVDGVVGSPDLVFCANQSFPGTLSNGEQVVAMAHMYSRYRTSEVPVVERWHERNGLTPVHWMESQGIFEGMGDAAWVPGRRVIVGGYGFRTDLSVYPWLSDLFGVPTVPLKLIDERFYHLDTCLSMINENTALYVPEAFDEASLETLKQLFPRLIALPVSEAIEQISCNGHSPDGKHYIVNRGATETNRLVSDLGLEVIQVDTSEFMKSGGSVYCMKLMLP